MTSNVSVKRCLSRENLAAALSAFVHTIPLLDLSTPADAML